MDTKNSLSSVVRSAIYVTAAAFGLVGLILFVAPEGSAANFAWKISPMVAMTMGGWYLGSAVAAALAAYYRRWSAVYAICTYVLAFSITESAVLILHAPLVRVNALLSWPYIGMLAIAVATSLLMLLEWLRKRPTLGGDGAPVPGWVRGIVIFFVLFVFFLGGFAFSGHWIGLNGLIFPEPLSLFTPHSFGAFYFSLAAGALPLVWARGLGSITPYTQGGLALILLITAAALVYLPSFNFAAHRFQSAYLGVYLVALVVDLYYLWTQRRQRVRSAAASTQ